MSDLLLVKVINGEIDLEKLLRWITSENSCGDNIVDFKVSRTEFITRFLNYIHEEISSDKKTIDSSPKHNDTIDNNNVECKTKNSPYRNVNKSASFPISFNNDVSNDSFGSLHSSTPKVLKIQSDPYISHNSSAFSPISPKFPTDKSSSRMQNLTLGDFMVIRKNSNKKKGKNHENLNESKNTSRRIKPTNLNEQKITQRQTENCFNFQNSCEEISVENVTQQRDFLAEERVKIMKRDLSTTISKVLFNNSNSKSEVDVDVAKVTFESCLNCIVDIYLCVLTNNMVLSVISEVHFLLSLLNKRFDSIQLNNKDECSVIKNDDERIEISDIFNSIHNIIYFAVHSLKGLADIIFCFDKSTLKLIADNKRIREYSPSFANELQDVSRVKPERIQEFSVCDQHQTNICFNLDTDNRKNFPNDVSFHAFRKQRDLFYEILTVWENNHEKRGWDFNIGLGQRIRSLFGFSNEPTNFVHFCRLFKAQLLTSSTNKEVGLFEEQFPFGNVDSDKLNKLKSRLITRQLSTGLNTTPAFVGHQEFYRDFIIVSSNHVFIKHLCDSLITEIVDLNNTKFATTELIDTDNGVDLNTRKLFLNCLKSLRVLAKFLGFVVSLPYKLEVVNYPEGLVESHVRVREKEQPALNIKELLLIAIKEKKIVLIIPWLTKYLAMLDYITLRLPYYNSIHKILFNVYKHLEQYVKFKYNVFMVKCCLGWLFDLPHFPDSTFFDYCTNPSNIEGVFATQTNDDYRNLKTLALDRMDIVTQNILYMCCPYLEEVKKILSSNCGNTSITNKHITPVTTIHSSEEIARKKLEQQLEDAFFSGQPSSLKKTVEFVSERIASICVKHVCNTLVPDYRKTALNNFKKIIEATGSSESHQELTKKHAQDDLNRLRDLCVNEVSKISNEKIPILIRNLLPLDTMQQSAEVCETVTKRMCIDRTNQWINGNIVVKIFTQDFEKELHKLSKAEHKPQKDKVSVALPPGGASSNHDDSTNSAFHMLEEIMNVSCDILELKPNINENFVVELLKRTDATLTKRNDVNEAIYLKICSVIVDLTFLLAAHFESIVRKKSFQSGCVLIWNRCSNKDESLFDHLFSPKNIEILSQSSNVEKSWESLAEFLSFLVTKGVVSADNFETQCTGFFRRDWDQDTLECFTGFMKKFVEFYRRSGGNSEKFAYLLEFLSDFCCDL